MIRVASLAKARNIPVIVACESYKFCDRVQVDSIVYNELGSVHEIAVPILEEATAKPPSNSTTTAGPVISSIPQRNPEYLGNEEMSQGKQKLVSDGLDLSRFCCDFCDVVESTFWPTGAVKLGRLVAPLACC